MTASITIGATLQSDGVTLELEGKLPLAPGRVAVTVQPAVRVSAAPMIEVLERIHREQAQRGRRPADQEQMQAEIARSRAEDEEYDRRWREIWSSTEGGERKADAL